MPPLMVRVKVAPELLPSRLRVLVPILVMPPVPRMAVLTVMSLRPEKVALYPLRLMPTDELKLRSPDVALMLPLAARTRWALTFWALPEELVIRLPPMPWMVRVSKMVLDVMVCVAAPAMKLI